MRTTQHWIVITNTILTINTSTRESRTIALKEYIKHVLEELWRIDEDEPLYNIFTKECMKTKDIKKVLRFCKADLNELSHNEDNDTVTLLENYEVRDVRMMFHYQRSLVTNNVFFKDPEDCRFSSITRKDCASFSDRLDAMALLTTTGDVTSTPSPNSGSDEKFKVSYFSAESFKKYIKRDAGLFTAFKEGKC